MTVVVKGHHWTLAWPPDTVVATASSLAEGVTLGDGILSIGTVLSRAVTTVSAGHDPVTRADLTVSALQVGGRSIGVGPAGFELLGTPPSDNRPHGVFATRSPMRPNPIGLTVVELLGREGLRLHVRGIDMLDGTPILDIKPYLSSVAPEALRRGWLAEAEARHSGAPNNVCNFNAPARR